MSIELLYEHRDFIIIHKPVGIAVQSEQQQTGLLPIICQQLNIEKLWLVHRLDKVTSGMLILAKHAEAAAIFGQLFADSQIEKYYLALSNKKPKKKQGAIKGGMHKIRDSKWILNTSNENIATTQFFSYGVMPNIRLFVVKPLTGKTHQIRVALKSISSPILGDKLYTGDSADRTYLHAFAIRFTYKNETIALKCLPNHGEYFVHEEMQSVINNADEPWALPWPNIKAR